jgi:glycine/D-amino acid oxidase-like deaminating enzyme
MKRRNFIRALTVAAIAARTRPLWAAAVNRVVIVGAGIIGTSIGYHLARRGADVLILEKEKPGAGATGNSFAFINASRKKPRNYYDLNLFGIEGWRRLQIEIGSELQVQFGGAIEWSAPGDGTEKLLDSVHSYQQWGYPVHQIDEAKLRLIFPTASPGPVGAAAFYEEDAAVDPIQALNTLLSQARGLGATLQNPAEVTGLDIDGDRIKSIQTTRGKIEGDVFVFAAGAGTQALAKLAGVNIPLTSSTGVLAHTDPQQSLLSHVAIPPGFSIRQNADGRVVVSGGGEGLKEGVSPQDEAQSQLRAASGFFPQLKQASLERVTVGHRVLPKDGFPIVGFAEKYKNLYIAATHSGVTLAPILGQLASLEILDGATADLLAPYRPARFASSES